MIDYTYKNIMFPKPVMAALEALQKETGASMDHIIATTVMGAIKQLEDKTTAEKKAAFGIK